MAKESFTRNVKEEVALFDDRTDLEFKSLLSGFIKINGNLVLRQGHWVITVRSENIKVVTLIYKKIRQLYPVNSRIIISEKKKLRSSEDDKVFYIEIDHGGREVLKDLGIYSEDKAFDVLPSGELVSKQENRKAYLAGAFLASGSVNSPVNKNYHLEIAVNSLSYAEYLARMVKKFNIQMKIIQRRKQYVVYVKKSDQISDFLNLIGAWRNLLDFESYRIQRDQYNSLNRIYNCDISNEKRAMDTGMSQFKDIEWYDKKFGINRLDEPLRVVAKARLNNPEATYVELTEYIYQTNGIKLSKPGVSYRMKKVLEEIDRMKGV